MAYAFKKLVIKHFEESSLADGSDWSEEWDSDENYKIKYIFIKADGAATTKSTITLEIEGRAVTKDKALCNTFGTNPENALELDEELKKNEKFKFTITNNEGAAKDFALELVLEQL